MTARLGEGETISAVHFTAQPWDTAGTHGVARTGTIPTGKEMRWGVPRPGINADQHVPWVASDFPGIDLSQISSVVLAARPTDAGLDLRLRHGRIPLLLLVNKERPPQPQAEDATHIEMHVSFRTHAEASVLIMSKLTDHTLALTFRPGSAQRPALGTDLGTKPFEREEIVVAREALRTTWWLAEKSLNSLWRSRFIEVCALVRRAPTLDRPALAREQSRLQESIGGKQNRMDLGHFVYSNLIGKGMDPTWATHVRVLGLDRFYIDPSEVMGGAVGHKKTAKWDELFDFARELMDSGVIEVGDLGGDSA